ncbi:hypothetical protein C8R43DRAFT_1088311 [Mycena crocata]|nr:hypothetical protein C8R43DRAFT_1088311 [Mycena crocata]
MWTWHWKRYLGAAHGVAGILQILLLCPANIVQPYMSSILRTVEWLIGCQDAHGNWPTAAPTGNVAETSSKEVVQWCHGASGILILLCTIASVQVGAELVYKHGFLSKGVGLCHGVAGSVFALLAVSDVLDRARNRTDTNNEDNYYLQRAVHLAQLATGHDALTARGEMRVPDHPLSLYEGLAGMCYTWAEVLERLVASERLNFGKERLKVEKQRQFDRSGMPGFDDVKGDTWASW